MCQIALTKRAEKKKQFFKWCAIFATTVTTVTAFTTVTFFYYHSTLGKSNLTHSTNDVMFSGQLFAILAMFKYGMQGQNFCKIAV